MVIRKIFNPSTNVNHLGAWSPFSLNCEPENGQTNFLFLLLVTKQSKDHKDYSGHFWVLNLMIETRVNLNRCCTHKLIDEQAISVPSKNNLFTLLCLSRIKIILFYELRRRRKLYLWNSKVAKPYSKYYIGGLISFLFSFRVAENPSLKTTRVAANHMPK